MALREFPVFWEPSIARGVPFCCVEISEARQGLLLSFWQDLL